MTCSEEPKIGDYEFFKRFDYYNDRAKVAEEINVLEITDEDICTDEIENSCYFFLLNDIFPEIQSTHIICEQFKKIYNLLSNSKIGKEDGKLENDDYSFMNYWLNDKIRGTHTNLPMCVNDFYQKLKEVNKKDYFKIITLDNKFYSMTKNDLDNMRKLYDLYNIKDKISESITEEFTEEKSLSCLKYTKECYRKYKEAIINCQGNCLHFYSLIKEFKSKYKNDLSDSAKSSLSCKSAELFELPNYGVVLKEHESVRIIRNGTLSVLLPLLGVFLMFKYSDKFTPFSQYILEKIKRRKNILFGEEEGDNELLSYTSDDDSSIYNNGEYNISYYNVRNY
ncbi:PIR Superfamily Protein [Plasmodium ovale wallikeri]|uniref:PIR Superfamily Protein n=2 Tax=Plasmodium ovale TaxID=36330 RepID=A0A1A9AQV7_PLAOA|nr:PIR Superfamily Protein [Plasmodium ovale wallikeri]SBT58598.1 PIR Superfamily Protein [Plasmodium ovale wallikeri]SBT74104.1 Plasmodium vivax Vir protein, putative [Plasmodium ovale]